MEYADKEDLLEYILRKRYIRETPARDLFRQIISGVKYLHNKGIVHRDLKCENVLLTSERRAIISDFGFAKTIEQRNFMCDTFCGSSAYAPIEILNGKSYSGL